MVKKSTLLEKLFGARKPPVAGREVAPTPAAARPTRPADRVPAPGAREIQSALEQAAKRSIEPAPLEVAVEPRPGNGHGPESEPEPRVGALSRVLGGKREEALQALTDGFRDLGGLLQGIQSRMEEQGARGADLNDKFAGLPAMAKAQVDFMASITRQLGEQREKTNELLARLTGLPALLDGIHKTLERHAAVEERTEKNLHDFRTTMDRIHSSIGTLTQENQKTIKEATESFERSTSRTTRVFEETQKQAYATFEKTQSAHLAQLAQVLDRSSKATRSIVVLLVLVFASLVSLFAIVLGR